MERFEEEANNGLKEKTWNIPRSSLGLLYMLRYHTVVAV